MESNFYLFITRFEDVRATFCPAVIRRRGGNHQFVCWGLKSHVTALFMSRVCPFYSSEWEPSEHAFDQCSFSLLGLKEESSLILSLLFNTLSLCSFFFVFFFYSQFVCPRWGLSVYEHKWLLFKHPHQSHLWKAVCGSSEQVWSAGTRLFAIHRAFPAAHESTHFINPAPV